MTKDIPQELVNKVLKGDIYYCNHHEFIIGLGKDTEKCFRIKCKHLYKKVY
jgi:hypothetical protein